MNIERNKTWQAIQRVRSATELVLTGKMRLKMFCSDPGLGKTETVLQMMKKHAVEPHYSSPTSPNAFCYDLWKHRNSTYFLDDVDILARSEPCANIAKMALGPQNLVICPATKEIQRNEERRLSGSDYYNPNIPPPTFKLGPMFGLLWNSNKNFTDSKVIAKEMVQDFKALVSRGLDPLWIPSDPQSVFDYTLWLLVADNMLGKHRQGSKDGINGGFSLEHTNDVIRFFCDNARRLKEISPRMAWKLAKARRTDPYYADAWKEQLADTTLYPALVLPEVIPLRVPPSTKKAA
jgi:hypothetical protein